MPGEEGVVVRGRVEIDTRQPFRSVREAVMLFGEKVLAGEVYGNKIKELQDKAKNQPYSKLGAVTAELEETKQCLQKAKEEGDLMAHCLNSVRQELEQTKRELLKLKTRETLSHMLDEPAETKLSTPEKHVHEGSMVVEFEKKRSVKFASPLLTKMIDCSGNREGEETAAKKKKKKPLVPLIGGLFMKKIKQGN